MHLQVSLIETGLQIKLKLKITLYILRIDEKINSCNLLSCTSNMSSKRKAILTSCYLVNLVKSHASYIQCQFKNRVPTKPMMGTWVVLQQNITAHEQTESNRVCYFRFSHAFVVSRGFSFQLLAMNYH